MVKVLSFILAAAVAGIPAVTSAAEPHVMWRTSDSGLLSVDPLATPSNPGSPTTPPGPGEQPLVMETQSANYFFTKGVAVSNAWFRVSNGIMPIQLTMSGSLPAGLSFMTNSTKDGFAEIIGTPTSSLVTSSDITVTAVDAAGKTLSRTLTVSLNFFPFAIAAPHNLVAKTGVATMFTFPLVNAQGRVAFMLSGALPQGLVLDPSGRIMGVASPGTAGLYNFAIRAQDQTGQIAQVTIMLTVTD